MTKQEFLAEGKLDFTVSKQTMSVYESNGLYKDTPFFATVNNETKQALGSVKSAYTVMQNKELLDLVLEKIGKDNYDLEDSSCGTFDKGRKVYMFIKYKKIDTDWGQEVANCYVYALSSHDGSQKLTFGVANKIHSCSNMFALLMKDKERNHIAKHYSSAKDKASISLESLIEDNLKGVASLMRTMQKHEISYSNSFVCDVLDLVADSNRKRKGPDWESKRKAAESAVHEEMNQKGMTYYGLFNGITNYLTHKADLDLISNITGKGSLISNKALQMIVKQMRETGCLN
tara:strand:- start:10150 stop:11013 length:864 start_codon:yes stop_codon:yes gene_type:complete